MPLNGPSPIVLFVYNRPQHTLATLQSLAKNTLSKSSKLYIFSDGAKSLADEASVKKVRDVICSVPWCGEVEIIERSENFGLARSVIEGVTQVCELYRSVIVLEDDLELAANFLEFMNDGLSRYEDDPKVMQVSGYMYPVSDLEVNKPFFLPFVTTWGWATWASAWQAFDPVCGNALQELRKPEVRRVFDQLGSYEYSEMLEKQLAGDIDSWGIRWNWSVFQRDGLVLYPPATLVENKGFDGSGTHGWRSRNYTRPMQQGRVDVCSHEFPGRTEVDQQALQQVRSFLKQSQNTLIGRIKKIMKSLRRGMFSPNQKSVECIEKHN